MQVLVVGEAKEVLWVKTETGGEASLSYRRDRALEKIITALESALYQARGEASQSVEGSHSVVLSDAAGAHARNEQFIVSALRMGR